MRMSQALPGTLFISGPRMRPRADLLIAVYVRERSTITQWLLSDGTIDQETHTNEYDAVSKLWTVLPP